MPRAAPPKHSQTFTYEALYLRTGCFAPDAATIDPDLVPDGIEGSATPEICGLNVVGGVRVEALVWRDKFIELMDDQKNGMELSRIDHGGVEGGIGVILSEAERVIGTVRR